MTRKTSRKTGRTAAGKGLLNGRPVQPPYLGLADVVPLFGRDQLVGGKPCDGKSVLLNHLVARAAVLGRPITVIDGMPLDPDLTPDPDFTLDDSEDDPDDIPGDQP